MGATAVSDHLKSLAKNGNTQALAKYKTLKGQDKIDFAVQLKVDREASFCTTKEIHSLKTQVDNTWINGWLTDAQVAKEEGLYNYTTCDSQKEILKAILDDLPSRPHERSNLAAMGVKQYDYSAKKLTNFKQSQVDMVQTEAKVECKPEDHDKFVAMVQNVENAIGSQATQAQTHSQHTHQTAVTRHVLQSTVTCQKSCLGRLPRSTSPIHPRLSS